ncbi:P-loop containing nucleoside triphosphate hydrolase protein [Hanseniaspora valbyensis NRRL Y-1626]|uniref:p-loop containing nucleoside triphosphate hydrolase protein n=1 Tax=Hanseniaspora valbyensis NRRL Y-1626 TaxID=766949 RepID=A0A1B7TI07_9ASCO|nr:P-loop containing nucleoside triphosphate hydrolase protein [Hanseniaspora valbyensis NRRL Y-1626]
MSFNNDKFKSINNTKNILLVLSGKGGVGKSSVTTQLALSLSSINNNKVGVLDIDLTGPSIPRFFDLENEKIFQSSNGWLPIEKPILNKTNTLKVISLGFLLNDSKNDSVVWKGPKRQAMIRQFIDDVYWGDDPLDYLIIDTPPGTTDEHIAIIENLRVLENIKNINIKAVIVTTPQRISINDVKKQINFCDIVELDILGVIENMSGFKCPYCDDCTDIFSKGGGENLCKELNLPFLGFLPIDPKFVELIEQQHDIVAENNSDLVSEYLKLGISKDFHKIIEEGNLK